MKPIEKKCFLCPQNKFGKCLLLLGVRLVLRVKFLLYNTSLNSGRLIG